MSLKKNTLYLVFLLQDQISAANGLNLLIVKIGKPSKNCGIRAKHFDEKFLKKRVRTTLRWELNPVPSICTQTEKIPSSILPSTSISRKPPTESSIAPDQLPEYQLNDKIEDFSKIDDGFCPQGYTQKLNKDKATFYKIVECSVCLLVLFILLTRETVVRR